jgi:hypothetical protein
LIAAISGDGAACFAPIDFPGKIARAQSNHSLADMPNEIILERMMSCRG